MQTENDDFDEPVADSPHRFGWFAAGGTLVAAAIGIFLYSTGYFDRSPGMGAQANEPRTIIESKR